MCTVTLEYNPNDALARRKLAALLATGLFIQKDFEDGGQTDTGEEHHRQLRDAFLSQSKKSMSNVIARYL